MDIEAHCRVHTDLSGRTTDYLVWQVLGAKQTIESHTQATVRFFCYPSGQYDALTIIVLKSAGYWGAVTLNHDIMQSSEHPFEWSRLRVRGSYDMQQFESLLNFTTEN